MNYFLLVATVSLIVQLVVISLVLIGFYLKRHFKYRLHGLIMTTALVSHLAVIFGVMIPSFVIGLVPIILSSPTSLIGWFSPLHAIAGSVTAILGVWIVGSWRFRQSLNFCLPKKRIMLITFAFWLISLTLGIIFYFILNWSYLFG